MFYLKENRFSYTTAFRLASNTSERTKNTGSAISRESTTARHVWRQLMRAISSSRTMNIVTPRFDSIWERTTKWTSSIINWTISCTITTWTLAREKWACRTWVPYPRQLWHLPRPQFPPPPLRLCLDKLCRRLIPIRRICRCTRHDRDLHQDLTRHRLLSRLHQSVPHQIMLRNSNRDRNNTLKWKYFCTLFISAASLRHWGRSWMMSKLVIIKL